MIQPDAHPDDGEARPARSDIAISRAEARRLVNYAFMASCANWTPFIRENGVGGEESPWAEFLRVSDRLWTVLFPDHPIRQSDPRLPAENITDDGGLRAPSHTEAPDVLGLLPMKGREVSLDGPNGRLDSFCRALERGDGLNWFDGRPLRGEELAGDIRLILALCEKGGGA